MGPVVRKALQGRAREVDDLSMVRGRSPRRSGLAATRGATLVEYSLIIAVFVFGSLGAIAQLDQKSGDYYEGASDDIGDLPQTGIDTSDDGTVPSTSSTTSTTTTTTTAPTTTTTTTTTTTIPTTTTTTIPTRSTITELTNISTNSGSSYNAIARVRIRHNKTSAAINGATVTIRMVDNNGSVSTRTCTTDSTGRCSVTWSRSDNRSPVTATVTGVSSSPVWDGVQASVSLPHP